MFRTIPLSIIRRFSLHTQQWYMSSRSADSQVHFFLIKLYMFRTIPPSIIRSFLLYTQQWYMSNRSADSQVHFFGIKLYMFRTIPPSIIRSFSLYTQLASSKLSADLFDIYHCCVYSEKLLMMDRGTVRNM